MNSFRKYFAEFLGTGTLVFIACGVAAITKGSIVPTALAFGLVIVAMAYSIGNVSGCHINPAVSLAMLISGRMGIRDFIGYVIAQFAGGIAASGLFWIIIPAEYHEAVGNGANHLFYSSPIRTIAVEVALTFVFVLAVLGVTAKKKYENIAGVVIGLSLTLVHLFGIKFTGTSVNPARSFGPALFTAGAALSNVWVFIVAPLVGGALAVLAYILLAGRKKSEE